MANQSHVDWPGETIIFIGPEGSGKSTIGKLIAPRLNKELFTLDRHRDVLYAPYSYDKDLAGKIYEEHGTWVFYKHWKYFEFRAVSHILSNAKEPSAPYHSKILDFGAGHSVYEDAEELAQIEALTRPYKNVFLFIPCEDVEDAVQVTEQRRGHALPLNKHFFEHKSNALLAKHIIYTKDKTAEECADAVLAIINGS